MAESFTNKESRIELAITKLTEISTNLDKMLSVHEQRLNQQEKQMASIETVLEKRREDTEVKLVDVYDTIRSEDKNILIEVQKLRAESSSQFNQLSDKINNIEKTIWYYMGGFSIIIFLLTYGRNIFSLLAMSH